MDRDEKLVLKAACIQAAATLLAGNGRPGGDPRAQFGAPAQNSADTGSAARYARDLFGKLTGEPWE
jgi:hypothetical protein